MSDSVRPQRLRPHQASPSLGFSRLEYWSGLPFPSPMHESEKWKWCRSVLSDSSDPMNCSLPGFSIHGIFQARVLEWGAIAFSTIRYYILFNFYLFLFLNWKLLIAQCLKTVVSWTFFSVSFLVNYLQRFSLVHVMSSLLEKSKKFSVGLLIHRCVIFLLDLFLRSLS